MWTVRLQDAGDGSGDLILELPEEVLLQTGWCIGDTVTLSVLEHEKWLFQRTNKERA